MGGGYDRSRSLGFLASDCKEHFKVRVVIASLDVEGGGVVAAGADARIAGLRLSLELAFVLLVWSFGDCIRFGGGCILNGVADTVGVGYAGPLNGGESCVYSSFENFHERVGSLQISSWLRSSASPEICMRPLFHVFTVLAHGLELCTRSQEWEGRVYITQTSGLH